MSDDANVTLRYLKSKKQEGKRAVIYARYSSEKQKSISIERQIEACTQYIKNKDYELIKVYSDYAKSASHNVEKREDFQKMLSDSKNDEFDVVVSYSLNRISREEGGGFYKYKAFLSENNVRLEYATEKYDSEYGGAISEAVQAIMASEYVIQLRQYTVSGMKKVAKMGGYNGGGVTAGYKVVLSGIDAKTKKYEIDEEAAPYIQDAFQQYLSGNSTKKIAEYLNSKGLKTARGTALKSDAVNRMLANPLYKGEKVTTFNNDVEAVEITKAKACEPIIDENTWNKVQIEKAKRSHKSKTDNKRDKYVLLGKLFCGKCGSQMCVDTGKGSTYLYYACNDRKRGKGPTRCNKASVPKRPIEDAVMQIITDLLWDEEKINDYVSALKNEENDNKKIKAQKVKLKKKISEHKGIRNNYMNAYGKSKDDIWLDKVKEESEQIEDLEEELHIIETDEKTQQTPEEFLNDVMGIKKVWDELRFTSEGRLNIINNFIERIEVYDPEDSKHPKKIKLVMILKTDIASDFSKEITLLVNLKKSSTANKRGSPNKETVSRLQCEVWYSLFLF